MYSFCYRKTTNLEFYKQSSDVELSTIDKFLELAKCEYDISFLNSKFYLDYVIYQFAYWYELKTKFGRIPTVNMVFGKKAFERFLQKNMFVKSTINKFLTSKKIDYADFYSTMKLSVSEKSPFFALYERERKRFLKNDNLMYYCIQFTDLFDQNSQYCPTCRFKTACKSVKNEKSNLQFV